MLVATNAPTLAPPLERDMTIDDRIATLERKVWCQDVIIYELTSVLQRLKQDQGRSLYAEVGH